MFIKTPIIVKRFNLHNEIRDILLDVIDNMEMTVVDNHDRLTTDYYNKDQFCEYRSLILPKMTFFLEKIFVEDLNFKNYMNNQLINRCWVQQYYKDGIHDWHIHENSMYNVVYYLEKPVDSPGTELKSPLSDEVFEPNVSEGDVLMFPSFLIHRSANNQSTKRKTIISFNVY